MKEQTISLGKKTTVAILLTLAVGLFVVALTEPKQQVPEGWVKLNSSVDSKLQEEQQKEQDKLVVAQDDKGQAKDQVDKGKLTDAGSLNEVSDSKTRTEVSATNNESGAVAPVIVNEDGKIDINHATATELDSLKGIGPAKAQAIVDDRQLNGLFGSVNDLLRVKGIGEKLLSGVKDSVVARP